MLSILLDQVRLILELPDELIDEHFNAFKEKDNDKNCKVRGTINVRLADPEALDEQLNEQPVRYESDFADTLIYSDRILCFFKEKCGWKGLIVKDSQLLCVPDEGMEPSKEEAFSLFDFMKGGVFLLLRQFGYFVLHSSSLKVNNKVLAFTAESGVGKTTHTSFWQQLFDFPIFNGDMIMIDANAETPQAIGIPWSGSTGITTNEKLPIAGIFFLERGEHNEVKAVNELEKLILLTQRMLSVNYDHREFLKNAGVLQKTVEKINCAKLICLPNEEAAQMAYNYAAQNHWI